MRYIESPSNDAYFNMALEEYVFEGLPRSEAYFMLWQNANAVVVGKYQNTAEEVNAEFIREHGISVVRRLSGGGAMYQDMGNLNFTFVVDQDTSGDLDFAVFIDPVIRALAKMGVKAERNGRNDITIDGKKFSGNAQYNKKGRTMHHGTLLFDSDLSVLGRALQVKPDKIESKGIKSVRSRVANIAGFLKEPMPMEAFKRMLAQHVMDANAIAPYALTAEDLAAANRLREEKYATWDWNYGRNPPYNARRERRYPFGMVCVTMNVAEERIDSLDFSGDFFGNGEIGSLARQLTGTPLQAQAIDEALAGFDVCYHISGMDAATLRDLILGA